MQEVTPENFLNILKGNAAAMSGIGSGKVIKRYIIIYTDWYIIIVSLPL